uniref:FERM and PDZ domain containing 4 n=1 Tax=Gadus morhua TaxID=8049 RepID=A0A8C5BMF2_GADMO
MNTPRDPRDYNINVSQSSSLEEVRPDGTPPAPRLVEMRRDPVLGFGFVAGSEKPVVVRSVTPGGPSEGKLIAGDEIIMINEEEVSSAPRERVIDLVRSCKESIVLTVVQPYPSPKSAFISAAKKAKLKSNPVKVRFAEEVIINGQVPNSAKDSSLLFMPNVLKVYLENGQTKSFRFDCSTSIKEVILTLQEKLSIKSIEHFSLMLEQRREGGACRLLLLHEQEMLVQVTRRPGADKMKCFFRISFVPRDPVELLRRDAVAFEYLYVQCCNDVVLERFGAELKYDAALRLAALQMYIITMTTRQTQKVSLKYIEKEWGLPLFLPPAVMASMKEKNIKKALTHILKTNHNLVPAGKKLTVLQAKVHYLRYLSELQLYGGREFKSILLQGEKQTEVLLLVGPRYGISHVINARTNLVALLADFSHVNRIEILTEDDANVRLELHVLDVRPITLIMESSDAMNLACLTAGYYRLLVDSRRSIFNMAHCNSMQGDDSGHERGLEWPYSPSICDGEDDPLAGDGRPYDLRHSDYNDNGPRGNAARYSPYFHVPDPDGGGGGGDDPDDDHDDRGHPGDPGGRRSPLPPPLPPSTRLQPQDSPRSAKVSFIFGGGAPPRNARAHAAGGYDLLMESPDVPGHRPPYLHHNADFGSSQSFYGGGGGISGGGISGGAVSHVYSNIGGEEGNEELRGLCYADTTDDAEDEDDASCEEDSTGGTPVNDEAAAGNGNRVPNCLNLMLAQGGVAGAAAGKTTFLVLSGSTDDIIDLTALPPPEGDDAAAADDDDDTVLDTLNLAIAAPPPGFRDSSDEDGAGPEGRPLSTPDNDDIPVSLIDSVPTREDGGGGGEGSRGGGAERRLENAVANTLQALEALSVAEQRPPPRPHAPRSIPGIRTSRGLSAESSSDSGNETNSSEMTEISELAAAHRLHESHMRLLVATREGYQPLLEEKTEFPVSPSAGETLQPKARSPSRGHLLQPPAVPPRRTPLLDTATSGQDSLHVGPQMGNCSAASTLQRPSSVTPGGKHHKKSGDSGAKYNTFSTRDGHWGGMGGSIGLLGLDRGAEQGGGYQRRQTSLMVENSVVDGLGVNSIPRGYRGLPNPPPPPPPPSASNRLSDEGEFRPTDNGAPAVEQDEHLVVASLISPNKKPLSAASDHGSSEAPADHPPISRQQSVARLCEYHLAKRISSLQGEAHNSLQGSLCSSLDAGGSVNGSVGGTPTDSPLGSQTQHQQQQPPQQQQQHHHHHHHHHHQRHPLSSSSSSLLRAVNYEEGKSSASGGSQGCPGQNKELHPHADPAMLRKMLPNIHPPAPGSEPPQRPASATPSCKHKETSV